jgi:transposase
MDSGGERAAFMYMLIGTAKLNVIDPHAWLADVLARIADRLQNQICELLPWNWRPPAELLKAAYSLRPWPRFWPPNDPGIHA